MKEGMSSNFHGAVRAMIDVDGPTVIVRNEEGASTRKTDKQIE